RPPTPSKAPSCAKPKAWPRPTWCKSYCWKNWKAFEDMSFDENGLFRSPILTPHPVQRHAPVIADKSRCFQEFAAFGRSHRLVIPFVHGELAANIEGFITAENGRQTGNGAGNVTLACG